VSSHPAIAAILKWFEHGHLPPRLQAVSSPFRDLAHHLDDLGLDGPEFTTALRKLLEAKDCAVRAELDRTGDRVVPADAPAVHINPQVLTGGTELRVGTLHVGGVPDGTDDGAMTVGQAAWTIPGNDPVPDTSVTQPQRPAAA
jgi:hypothetical protein